MRESREKVKGIPLDGFIFFCEKGELEYGMEKRQKPEKTTVGWGRGPGTEKTIAEQY